MPSIKTIVLCLGMLSLLTTPRFALAQFGGLFGGPAAATIETKDLRAKLDKLQVAKDEAEKNDASAPESDFVLIDVRTDAEVNVSVIPGAITKTQYEKNAAKYKGKLAIAYCTIGGRSGKYAQQLEKNGVKSLNYKGSILEWVKAELPLVTLDGKPTQRVHIYSDRYTVPKQYEAVTK